MNKIVVVEDEDKLRENVEQFLSKEGFEVRGVGDGLAAVRVIREMKPDLVILDVMLPGLTGIQVCQLLRQESDLPILIVSALGGEEEVLKGLEEGADDYVVKPFRMRELVARVKAILRRRGAAAVPLRVVVQGELSINLDTIQVVCRGNEVALTPTEFKLLTMLAQQPGRAFTRLQLLEGAVGEAYENYERTVDTHIFNLRKKIELQAGKPQYIQTVFGIGYRFGEQT
ncbi:response regulator transcription factor [Azotosporobacter soli]|uniref:response regulator transcription factor n=1 Tax=Azotosporobacter soli TaxID=3055040 RepID=UPI0031FEDC6C